MTLSISGNIVDIIGKRIFPGIIHVKDSVLYNIEETQNKVNPRYIMPGFIDAHIHIESSMLIPSEFARLASVHGTVATVSDPHEIANVMGSEGVRFMIKNGKQVPFHFFFGAPSCVPATTFETAGATLTIDDIRELFTVDGLLYLSEMMNFPGVLAGDPSVMDKIKLAQSLGKPVDGHAPGLKGDKALQYISAGISTDHECYTLEEALDKIAGGMSILIREGSAAKNFEALHPLIGTHPEKVMLCSDDKHPHELLVGHINALVKRAIHVHGHDFMDVLRCASLNPVKHYGLDVGLLQKGDSADFIIVDNLRDFTVLQTWIKGQCVANRGKTLINSVRAISINNFQTTAKTPRAFEVPATTDRIRVIDAVDGQLVTESFIADAKIVDGLVVADPERDLLKLAVINRYRDVPPAIGFIRNFGLKKGAIASCIAHDSHNIIVVGVDDRSICECVNALIESKGGIAVAEGNFKQVLPLPVAGIMSAQPGETIADLYTDMDLCAKALGAKLGAPFMTLSFMALLVIPSLKLSDKGLFDGNAFDFTDLCV